MQLCAEVFAQANRYMVFFKDKNGSPYNISEPIAFLSQKAITRRIQQGITVEQEDIPVNATYIQGVVSTGAEVFFSTRWMNGVLVQCDANLVPTLESLSYVSHVELVAPGTRLNSGGRKRSAAKTRTAKTSVATMTQLQMIGLDEMHSAGHRGEGITIGIFDSGFEGVDTAPPFDSVLEDNRIVLMQDFVANSDDVFQYDEHGTEVFSIIAAYQEGAFTGGAYEANYQLYVTEDVATEYRIEEYNWLFAAERADSAGVDIINSSLGYYDFDNSAMDYPKSALDGKTTIVTRAATFAAERGIIVVCSAGNEGALSWQMITAPADAEKVLAVASVNQNGDRVSSSSTGPSADGRIKPDVAALGLNTTVIKPNGLLGSASGTSLSTPLITSLAAGVWQRYGQLTNFEVIDAIKSSASQAGTPDNLIGYGIPNFKAVVNYLEQHPQVALFDIFPNPVLTDDTITIRPSDPNEVTDCRIELLSPVGQVLADGTVTFSWLNRTYTATVNQLTAGMYFVRITVGDKRFVYKVVKKG
jgi:hypothetical protein